VIVLTLVVIASCRGDSGRDQVLKRMAIDQAQLEELAKAHSAVVGWEKDLSLGALGTSLTVDVQERLVDRKEPIVFRGRIADIQRAGAGMIALFKPSRPGSWIYFRLVVPTEMVKSLRQLPRESWRSEVAGVARVEAVRRPTFELSSQSDGDTWEIEPGTADYFLAEGTLIAFRSLRENDQ